MYVSNIVYLEKSIENSQPVASVCVSNIVYLKKFIEYS